MQILVASDRIGAMSSRRAGEVIASGWRGAETQVVPVGEAGSGFLEAYADAFDVRCVTAAGGSGVATVAQAAAGTAMSWEPATAPSEAIPYSATSRDWGGTLRRVLERRPSTVYVDLAGPAVHDAGAGALAALGALGDAPLDQGAGALAGLTHLELGAVRDLLAGVDLVGVVPEAELSILLLGLRGITARRGREHDDDPARMLAVDAALERFASLAAPEVAGWPGSGACGGLGFAVLAMGGRLVTGPAVTLNSVTLNSVTLDTGTPARRPELVVSGCSVFDFASRGGGVVAEVARLATATLAPCIVLAGEAHVGAREMRAMGIEATYAVAGGSGAPPPSVDGWPGEDDLARLAARVARSWRW